ncbi:hypothetical protein OG948_38105 (plasmid) [Embleya sp. NBC_00888]|uniref:hypothetical protein n=1 Tax=Embleya sp. NBC_00888 TaxID=2975960 RepID=UPI002F90AFE5|nr:hypothetical protein OG948_38105 [Embleya sp. NBC_00888]
MGANLGDRHGVDHVRADPHCFTLLPAGSPVPEGRGVRSMPLVDPMSLYAWLLLWRDDHAHPELNGVPRMFAEQGAARRRLEYDPDHDRLPDVEPGEARGTSPDGGVRGRVG